MFFDITARAFSPLTCNSRAVCEEMLKLDIQFMMSQLHIAPLDHVLSEHVFSHVSASENFMDSLKNTNNKRTPISDFTN